MDDIVLRASLFILILAAFVATALAGCGPRKDQKLPSQSSLQPSLTERVRVLAGDVLVIDGQHIRLAGAYGPQGIPDARCWAEALAAKQATVVLRRMIVDGRTISFKPTGGQDVFGRTYATVSLNGVDLGQTLYDEGLAAKTKGAFGWCRPISEAGEGAPTVNSVMDAGY